MGITFHNRTATEVTGQTKDVLFGFPLPIVFLHGGIRRIIHVPQQVWKPTVWFPLSKEKPFWSVNMEVNVLFWIMVVVGFLLRFWSLDFPPYVV